MTGQEDQNHRDKTGGVESNEGVPETARARRAIAELSARSRRLLERARVAERMRGVTTNWLIVAAVVAVAAQVLAVGAVVSSYRQKSEMEAMVSSRDELRDEIAGLEAKREELARLEGELVVERGALDELREGRVDAERRMERLAATEEAAVERLAGLRERAVEAEAAVKLLESRQAAAADRLAAAEDEAAKRKAEAESAAATLGPIAEQTAATEGRLSEARAAWTAAIDDLQVVRTTLGERKAELAAIEMQVRLAEDAAGVHEARVDALVKRGAELAAAIEMDRAAVERLVADRRLAEAELSELRGEVDSAAAELADKRGRLGAVLERIDQAERERKAVEEGVEVSVGGGVGTALAAVEPTGDVRIESGSGGVGLDEDPAEGPVIIEGQDR